jgi:DNA-binding GntR family transcriptional regulator
VFLSKGILTFGGRAVKLLQALPRETAKNYALRVLKENIVDLELAPGSQISENELSAALGISRTPVREALADLEKVKLVEIVPQKKTSIALIDYDLVEEASFMRCTLETAVIDQVCCMRTEQDLMRFEQNLAAQRIA